MKLEYVLGGRMGEVEVCRPGLGVGVSPVSRVGNTKEASLNTLLNITP